MVQNLYCSEETRLIDQVAEPIGAKPSRFVMDCFIDEAKNQMLDQSTICVGPEIFQKVINWMDKPATEAEVAGMYRILRSKALWKRA